MEVKQEALLYCQYRDSMEPFKPCQREQCRGWVSRCHDRSLVANAHAKAIDTALVYLASMIAAQFGPRAAQAQPGLSVVPDPTPNKNGDTNGKES